MKKNTRFSVANLVLWPGTKFCERLGIDPEADAGLIRWMINTLVYLIVALVIAWIIVANS
ncbi:hypothetical protein [Sulfitobacter sp. S190]|uniref:hypothetical protein n=1 Tax=Sulfitobacter sp. S190 TaxID=2867022 RepID=UPI0021A89EAD|nr:hypothetical protein [Sulfitobacter sp. S190]UWR24592.1 hypothetical protein K3756_19395 [Sulfitobacter sp. S190]